MNIQFLSKEPNESVNDYALRILRSNIVHLNLEPGERISVVEVSKILNISRTPVQNAFTRLSEEAMLDIYPQSGSYISMIDMKRVYESLCLRNLMDQTVLYRLCETGIPAEALYRLNTNLNDQDFYNSQGNYIQAFELDNSFHETLYQLCHMESIYHATQTITVDQSRVRVLKLRSAIRNEKTNEEHRQMLQAIETQDLLHAHEIASEHVRGFSIDLESVYINYARFFSNWDEYNPKKFVFRTESFRNFVGLSPDGAGDDAYYC